MVGIFSWYGIPQPFEERIQEIKNAGFESVSMWIDEEGHWELDKNVIPKIVRDNGLYIEYAHAPYRNINNIWREKLSESVEETLVSNINYCKDNRISIMVMHLTQGFKIKDINRHGISLLNRIIRYAKDVGIQIAVENTKNNMIIEKVLQEIEDNTLGLCFDTSHDNLYAGNKFELMVKYGPRLLCLHISDNDGLEDDHWLPCEGKIDWKEFVRKFPKMFNGILNLEVVRKDKSLCSSEYLISAYEKIQNLERQIHNQKAVTI